jgi:hypothetical protein
MSDHLYTVDTLIITLDNHEHGVIKKQLPPQGPGGEPRYNLEITGRPAREPREANKGHRGQDRPGRPEVPGRAQGNNFVRNDVVESLIARNATPEQLAHADALLEQIDVRAKPEAWRIDLRNKIEDQVDDDNSTDNEIIEGHRFLTALTNVEDE